MDSGRICTSSQHNPSSWEGQTPVHWHASECTSKPGRGASLTRTSMSSLPLLSTAHQLVPQVCPRQVETLDTTGRTWQAEKPVEEISFESSQKKKNSNKERIRTWWRLYTIVFGTSVHRAHRRGLRQVLCRFVRRLDSGFRRFVHYRWRHWNKRRAGHDGRRHLLGKDSNHVNLSPK